MKRVGLVLLVLLCGIIGLWVGALVVLPDAAPDAGPGAAPRAGPLARLRAAIGVAPAAVAPRAGGAGIFLLVPVAGVPRAAIRDSWGDPRDNGLRAHHGTDVMAPGNTPVLAAAPGTVEKLWTSAAGGTTVYVRSPERGWTYYYAHLAAYAPGLHEGQVLRAGDPVGYVGDTGNAGAGNFHLHFGLTRTTPAQHWYQGDDVDPYPYLAGKPLPR